MEFQKETKEQQTLRQQACPMTASLAWNPESDSEQERIQWFDSFSMLPMYVRTGLLSNKIVKAILELAKNNGIESPEKMGEISRIVREAFFKAFDENQTRKRVQEKLEIVPDKIEKFITDLKEIISLVKQTGEEMLAETTEKLPIIPALKKYEKLAEQEITENWIEIEISENIEKVSPSVKNWLEDYIQTKGAQAHDNLERSDYVYKAKNTERLSTPERERLSTILRSYDRDELLLIDKEQQELLFDTGAEIAETPVSQTKPVEVQTKLPSLGGGSNSIELAPFDVEKKEEEKEDLPEKTEKKEKSSKPHEIGWYGTDPFDNLEKIDEKKLDFLKKGNDQNDSKNSNTKRNALPGGDFQKKSAPQNTKNIIDLKKLA